MTTEEAGIWRSSKTGVIKFASATDFLYDASIASGIRDSYNEYINEVVITDVPLNEKGFYKFEWVGEDKDNNAKYTVTYSEDYGFGVMRAPLPKKPTAPAKKIPEGQTKLPPTEPPAVSADHDAIIKAINSVRLEIMDLRNMISIIQTKVTELHEPSKKEADD